MDRTYLERAEAACHLTDMEQQHFELIIDNAKSMGWLALGQTIVAARHASGIIVRSSNSAEPRERRYEDRARWLYQLLHDLAQGAWKVSKHST